ncbi:MAG: hypothetical protein ABIJ00_05570 [Candidatus Eisenbacteria bacterium]
MKLLLIVSVMCVIASPALSYEGLGEAFQATNREDAVQYIIDKCRLDWTTGWPTGHPRQWNDVRAYVSPNRRYCLLSKAGASEWGQGGDAEYCLVGVDSGPIWLKHGTIGGEPGVSDHGTVAIFEGWKSASELRYIPVGLLMISADDDTFFTRRWSNHIPRPIQGKRLSESYGFSLDGRFFIVTMNVADPDEDTPRASGYNNTMLHCIDLEEGSERVEDLGHFWPKTHEITDKGAELTGEWQRILSTHGSYDYGFYRITWSPWQVEKIVVGTRDLGEVSR